MSAEQQILERLESIEGMLRRLLPGADARVEVLGSAVVVVPDFSAGPFALSDRELRQAERLLPVEKGRILRLRVMAFRMESKGQREEARWQRSKADRLERQLQQEKRAA